MDMAMYLCRSRLYTAPLLSQRGHVFCGDLLREQARVPYVIVYTQEPPCAATSRQEDVNMVYKPCTRLPKIVPKIPVGAKRCVEWAFGYGKSEYKVSFGLAPRNGELSPSDPETLEPFNSPFRDLNPERSSYSNFPQNLGSVSQNLGSQSLYTQK